MAEGTSAQVQLREMEDNWNARFTALTHSVDDKLTALSDSLSNSFNSKLDSKMTEVFKAINVLTKTVIAERSTTMMQGETRQAVNFADWSRSPRMEPDLHRSLPQQAPQEIRPRIGEFRRGSVLRSCGFDERICQLKELEQEEGIEEYYNTFDLMQKRIDLPGEVLLSWFVAGLKIDTQRGIRSFRPKTVREAYVFGRLYESAHPSSRKQSATPLQAVPVHESFSDAPKSGPLLLTTPVSMESCSAPQSSILLVRENDPPTQTRQEQLHSFKDNLEEHKGELSTFNHQDSNTRVVCEFDSEDDTTGVSIGFGRSCLTFGVNNQHDPHCEISGILVAKNSAHEVFDKMPEPVSVLNMFSGDIFGSSSTNEIEKSGVISYVFDPEGRITKEVMTLEWNGSGVASRNDKSTRAEIEGSKLQDEPLVFTVFDPRGAYGLLKGGCATESYYLPKLPVH